MASVIHTVRGGEAVCCRGPSLMRLSAAAAVLCTLWLGLGSARLWDRDEPRNARCAVEMLERGDWAVPTFNGELRTHKPILLYWMQMTAYSAFGVSEFSARLPSALCGSATVLAVWWLTRRVAGELYAAWAAVCLCSCAMFAVASRAATPDAPLIACASWGIVLLAADRLSRSNSQNDGPQMYAPVRRWYRFGGYAALGLAVLAKGPVGLVIPLAIVLAWSWLQEVCQTPPRTRRPVELLKYAVGHAWSVCRGAGLPVGIAIVAAVAVPWYVWVGVRTDGRWLYGFFIEHNVNRAVSAMEGHSGGLWYYPLTILLGTFPWSLMLLPTVWWARKNIFDTSAAGPLVRLGCVWVAVTIAAFSCAGTKLPSYITPCYPGAAMLFAGFFAAWHRGELTLPRRLALLAAGVTATAGVGVASGIFVAATQLHIPPVAWLAVFPAAMLIPAAMLLRRTSAGGFWPRMLEATPAGSRPAMSSRPAVVFAAAAVTCVAGLISLGPGIVSGHRADLDAIVAAGVADEAADPDSAANWLAVGTIEPSWVFYMRHPIREVPADDPAAWVGRAADHLAQPGGRLVLGGEDFDRLCRERGPELAQRNLRVVPLVRCQRFLSDQETVVAAAVPADLAARMAAAPPEPTTLSR